MTKNEAMKKAKQIIDNNKRRTILENRLTRLENLIKNEDADDWGDDWNDDDDDEDDEDWGEDEEDFESCRRKSRKQVKYDSTKNSAKCSFISRFRK
jgi:hypothetical protein